MSVVHKYGRSRLWLNRFNRRTGLRIGIKPYRIACFMIVAGRAALCLIVLRPAGMLSQVAAFIRKVSYALLPNQNGVPMGLWRARMRHCIKCPMFDSRWLTCGTAGETYSNKLGRVETLGCWCEMRIKSTTHCNCWAYERNIECGWQERLNSYPRHK